MGTGSSFTFAPNTLANGDSIKCILTANNSCQTTSTAVSNVIVLTVNQTPNVPGVITTVSKTPTTINLTWTAIAGASNYFLDVASDSGFISFINGYNNLSVAGITQNVSGLTPFTKYYSRVRSGSAQGCVSANSVVHIDTTAANNITVTITAFLQGLYAGGRTMTPAIFNADGTSSATIADTITVELHASNSPYDMMYTKVGTLSTIGIAVLTFPGSTLGNSYYLVIKNRNSVETWSALPVVIIANTNYDFSAPATPVLAPTNH